MPTKIPRHMDYGSRNLCTLAEGQLIQHTLEQYTGGKATVVLSDESLLFTIDCGSRMPAVGGYTGGLTVGTLAKGSAIPKMVTGVNPLTIGQWVDVLPIDWFPVDFRPYSIESFRELG